MQRSVKMSLTAQLVTSAFIQLHLQKCRTQHNRVLKKTAEIFKNKLLTQKQKYINIQKTKQKLYQPQKYNITYL